MTLAIHPTVSFLPSASYVGALIENIKGKAWNAFAQPMHKIADSSHRIDLTKQTRNARSFLDHTWAVVEGGIWGAFWIASAYCVVESLCELCKVFTVEHPASERFKKIGLAVKKAFVDSVSLVSSSAFMASWGNTVGIISLGKYLPLIKNLCFGTSLVINTVETGADIYTIWSEKEAILAERLPAKREIHKQLLCHALMKLISNVSMVAWAALGLATLAGAIVTPVLTTALLISGCVVGFAAIFYKAQVDENAKAIESNSSRELAHG